jgi:hypothetical protein
MCLRIKHDYTSGTLKSEKDVPGCKEYDSDIKDKTLTLSHRDCIPKLIKYVPHYTGAWSMTLRLKLEKDITENLFSEMSLAYARL